MPIVDMLSKPVADEVVTMGDGNGQRRIDELWVWVRRFDGRLTRAYLPAAVTSNSLETMLDERLPIEGTLLVAERMGNRPPNSNEIQIDVSTL